MKRLLPFLLLLVMLPINAQDHWQEALRDWLTAEDVEEGYSEELMEQLESEFLFS